MQGPHKLFVWAVIALGLATLGVGLLDWKAVDPLKSGFFLLLALFASGWRFQLPQIVGAMSVSFVFILLGIVELSLGEALVMACASAALQALVHREQGRVPAPAVFHVANAAVAVTLSYHVYHAPWAPESVVSLAMAASVLYATNTFPVAVVVALSNRRSLAWVWREANFRIFPYYMAGAVVAGLYHFSSSFVGSASPLLLVPVAFLTYCLYHSYNSRLAVHRTGSEGRANLHARTVEALAMAIEAKDMTGHDHLRRLQFYSLALGRELGLSEDELEAVRTAAVLHDIGKLAVPEHILSKPGKLTREEFDKVKIHPSVGAQILERVEYDPPVIEIVRRHHEKWNGGGYPDGLRGEAIPMGARILAVVDCFDALISERPYRGPMPFEQALSRVAAEAGVSFDPRVTAVLQRMAQGLEGRFRSEAPKVAWAPTFPQWDSANTPPPALAETAADGQQKPAYLDTIAAARQEAQIILELTQVLGNSLHLEETLSVLSSGLRRLVQFETFTLYVLRDGTLVPRYASGECTSLFLSRHVPLGQGIAGWVAQQKKAILNGNPTVEMGGGSDSMRGLLLNSALAVPLTRADNHVAGVLMLCRRDYEAFSRDDLRIVLGISAKLATAMENTIKFEQATASASTDFLTGLPNARALHSQLESELSRGRRMGGPLTVLVTDLDGFKEVNDRHGHLIGNELLKAVATALRNSCREYDYVARMGGDEFVILLPGLADHDVQIKITQLNQAVSDAGLATVPGSAVSLSVGQARFPEEGQDPERLLAQADQRMYQAKTARKLKQHRAGPRGFEVDWVETPSNVSQ
ncbi:MAG: diguanylate cyclase [Bryobacteraceae bacterium]